MAGWSYGPWNATGRPIGIFRVQDYLGRGPYRPGVTDLWVDFSIPASARPSILEEFGTAFLQERPPGAYLGSGFLSLSSLRDWFTPAELLRLSGLGYETVFLQVDGLLRKSARQVVFYRFRSLRFGIIYPLVAGKIAYPGSRANYFI